MHTTPLLKQALGPGWERLAAPVRNHYRIRSCSDDWFCLQGTLTVDFPDLMVPVIRLVRRFGGLIEKRGHELDAGVCKRAFPGEPGLFWHRIVEDAHGRQEFRSSMVIEPDGTLLEKIGGGFGIRLQVSEHNHDLVYQSRGYVWSRGALRVRIPDWMLLGTATIREHASSARHFELDFRIHHPLFGCVYSYSGRFEPTPAKPADGQ